MERKEIRKYVDQSVKAETQSEIKEMWKKFGNWVLGVFGCICLILILVLMQRGLASRPETPAPPIEGLNMDEMTAEASEAARGFLAAKTVPAKAQHVFDPRRVMPIMQGYYETKPFDERGFKELIRPRYHVASTREFLLGSVVFDDESREFWVFEKDDQGKMKLQWEVAVNHHTRDWDGFLDDRDTTASTFRVTLEMLGPGDEYYNFAFDDPEEHLALMVRTPRSDRYVYGYLDRASDAFKSFMAVRMMSNLRAMPVIAKLRFLEDGAAEQVLVEDIETFSWIAGVDM